MFTSSRANLYESFDGFSVEMLGRTGLCHREAGRQMFVDSEVVTGPSAIAVYKDTIQKWDPAYNNVPITDSDRGRILNNIREAFRSQGFEIDVNLACYFYQIGDIQNAKNYLKKAFELDPNCRMTPLEDEDLKPLWESL